MTPEATASSRNQWGSGSTVTNDPSGEVALQLSFFQHAYGGGDTYFTSTTQYCEGVALYSYSCGSSGTHVGHPSASALADTWLDNASATPSAPSASDLAAEAARAAAHFGVSGDNVQIIVDSAAPCVVEVVHAGRQATDDEVGRRLVRT